MRQNIAALLAFAGLAASAAAAQAAPDLSAYDCVHVGDGTPLASRQVLQVIAGQPTAWTEYLSRGDSPKLVCIDQARPVQAMLSAAAAQALLTASAAVGAPGVEHAASTDAPTTADGKFHDAPPMPLPRAVDGRGSAAERAASLDGDGFAMVSHRLDGSAAAAPSTTEAAASVPGAASTVERQQTVGVDDRVRVSTTTSSAFPDATVGFLVVTYPSGNSFRCTGTVVSAYVVLTAGHCIHNNNEGGFATSVQFSPAQNEISFTSPTTRPFGTKKDAKWVRTTTRWTQISGPDSHPTGDYQYDLAAIEFATPFTFTATYMPVVFNDTASIANTVGYPAQVQGGASEGQWTMNGSETGTSSSQLRSIGVRAFAIDATGGQSGSAFWEIDAVTGRQQIMGHLSYGDDLNDNAGGPWYGGANQTLVTGWLNWTPATDTTAVSGNSVAGLRVPAVFDSSQTTTQSFLRFFNTGTTAGTVDVTLASYDDGKLLATWTSPSIPANASPQFDIATIENGATGGTLVKHGYYSLSIRPHFNGYFQHVLWRRADGTLTNATDCDTKPTTDPTTLMNVHTSTLNAGYPAMLAIQNTGSTAATVTFGIYDAASGRKLSSYTTPSISANGQLIQSVRAIEQSIGFSPSSSQYHYNFKAETSFTGTVQSLMTNTGAGVVSDMTAFCTLIAQ